jgi:phosphonate transport system substrate-binding protein
VREADRFDPRIELLAAPVMRRARYGAQPVYFTDVMVRHDHRAKTLADLRGALVAINEPNSHSGYHVLRHALAGQGLPTGFFCDVIESGAHQRSLELIESGEVDAAPIDTTVLETEVRARPELATRLRVVATLGPSPMPPWVASTRLAPALRQRLRDALLALGTDAQAREALAQAEVQGFAAVDDDWYGPIRQMSRSAARYPLPVTRAA